MGESKYQVCTRCIMDTTDPDIVFDENGVCSYCHSYDSIIRTIPMTSEEKKKALDTWIARIKTEGKHKKYDSIIGLSGGVDSSYLALKVKQAGLRPLVVHTDTGWNSEIAVSNVEKIVKRLNLDLITEVINWDEIRDLQRAYFLASVPNCDVPQDHAIIAAMYKHAAQNNIGYIISGHNLVTEYVIPPAWGYDSGDIVNLKAIHKKFGKLPLKTYPQMGTLKRAVYYNTFRNIKTFRMMYYLDYNKLEAIEIIKDEFDWKSYGDKHHESNFTKFFQSFYLPVKFGFDKRRAHLSNMILSGMITREDAIEEMKRPVYPEDKLRVDKEHFLRKLGFSAQEWEEIMAAPLCSHRTYPNERDTLLFRILNGIRKKR